MRGTEESRDGSFLLLGDQPAIGGEDPLGFDEVAGQLAKLILDSRESTPFTLGIEGAWGMGKSTLMGRLHTRLEAETGVTAILFNAWTADGGGILEGLVKAVLNQMDPNVLRRSLRNEQLITGLRLAAGLVAGFLGFGSIVDTFWEKVSTDPRAKNDLRKLVEGAVDKWRDQSQLGGEDRILCILVDDLDRCSPRGVIEVFEAMKLYLSVKGIVFIVGYDQGIVSDLVLQEKGYSSESIQSRDYVEKFIQIDFRVPRAITDRSNELVDSLLKSSGTQDLFGQVEREIVISGSGSNPRKIKRFINTFVLAYGLEPMWREFRPQDLIRLFLLRMQFREFLLLLETPREDDPVQRFLAYRELRDLLRRHDEEDRPSITEALRNFGIATGGAENYEAILARLNETVDREFVRSAERLDLVGLLESLSQSSGWSRMREAIALGELAIPDEDKSAREASAADEMRERVLSGLRVLWVDDTMELNETLITQLVEAGAEVATADGNKALLAQLQHSRYDVLISNINRDGHDEAGFDVLEQLRGKGIESPPYVIFFVMNVSGQRQRRAAAFNAQVTNDPAALFEFMVKVAKNLAFRSPSAGGGSSDFYDD